MAQAQATRTWVSASATMPTPAAVQRLVKPLHDGTATPGSGNQSPSTAVFEIRACKGFTRALYGCRGWHRRHARHPGAGRLRLGHGSERKREDRDCQYFDSEPKLVHLESPFSVESLGMAASRTRILFRPLLRRVFPLLLKNAFYQKSQASILQNSPPIENQFPPQSRAGHC